MKLAELVLEVVEHDIPPMSTRTFTEVAKLAMEKDPGGGRTRMPGSSSAAKIVNGIPQHSSLPWHRVVYGDGDFIRQSKRRKAQRQRLQDEGARPRTDETVQAWAARTAVPYVACYQAAVHGATAGAAVYTVASDTRIQAWAPDRVEPIRTAEEAEQRGFTRLPDLPAAGAEGGTSASPAAQGPDPSTPATAPPRLLSHPTPPTGPPARATEVTQHSNAESEGSHITPVAPTPPERAVRRAPSGQETMAPGSGSYREGLASGRAPHAVTGGGHEEAYVAAPMGRDSRAVGFPPGSSHAAEYFTSQGPCLRRSTEAEGLASGSDQWPAEGPRSGGKRRREDGSEAGDHQTEGWLQGGAGPKQRGPLGSSEGSLGLPGFYRPGDEEHSRHGDNREGNNGQDGRAREGMEHAAEALHEGSHHQYLEVPTDGPGEEQSGHHGDHTPRAADLMLTTSQELLSPPFLRRGLDDYFLVEGNSPPTYRGRHDFLAEYLDQPFADHEFSTADLMSSGELLGAHDPPHTAVAPAAPAQDLLSQLPGERVGAGDPPAPVVTPSEAFGAGDDIGGGGMQEDVRGIAPPDRSATGGPADPYARTPAEDGAVGLLNVGGTAGFDGLGGVTEVVVRGDGAGNVPGALGSAGHEAGYAGPRSGAAGETFEVVARQLAGPAAGAGMEEGGDDSHTKASEGTSRLPHGGGEQGAVSPVNGRHAGGGNHGTNGMHFGGAGPIPQRDGAVDDDEGEEEDEEDGDGGRDGDRAGAEEFPVERTQRKEDTSHPKDEEAASRDVTRNASTSTPEEGALEPAHKKQRPESKDETLENAVRSLDAEAVKSGLFSKGFFHAPGLLPLPECAALQEDLSSRAHDDVQGVVAVKQVPPGIQRLREELYRLALGASMQILNGSTMGTGTQLTLPDQLGEHWQRCGAMGLRPPPAYTMHPGDDEIDLPQQDVAGDQRLRVPIQAGVLLSDGTKGAATLVVKETPSDEDESPKDQSKITLEVGDVVLLCTGGRPEEFQGGMAGKRVPMHFAIWGAREALYMALPFDAEH